MKTVAILILLAVGCGSVDAARVSDGGDAGAAIDTAVPDAGNPAVGACSVDADGYTAFFDAVVESDCWASYTISRGVNTFDCTCSDPVVCSQASLKLVTEGQACLQHPPVRPPHDGGMDTGGEAGAGADAGQDSAPCVPRECIVCVNGVPTTPPGTCM